MEFDLYTRKNEKKKYNNPHAHTQNATKEERGTLRLILCLNLRCANGRACRRTTGVPLEDGTQKFHEFHVVKDSLAERITKTLGLKAGDAGLWRDLRTLGWLNKTE